MIPENQKYILINIEKDWGFVYKLKPFAFRLWEIAFQGDQVNIAIFMGAY